MMQLIKKLSEPKLLLFIAVIYSIFITVLFLFPFTPEAKPLLKNGDKIVHIILHFGLYFIWTLFYFNANKERSFSKSILIIGALCLFYGIIIEILQYIFPFYRQADFWDIVANFIGTVLGLIAFLSVNKRFKM